MMAAPSLFEGDGDAAGIDERDARALTECMTVLPKGGDIYTVIGQHGNGEHRVDAREDHCTCPDYQHRDPAGGCKHRRRIAFATGERPIPAWVDDDAVDPLLGEHVDNVAVSPWPTVVFRTT